MTGVLRMVGRKDSAAGSNRKKKMTAFSGHPSTKTDHSNMQGLNLFFQLKYLVEHLVCKNMD